MSKEGLMEIGEMLKRVNQATIAMTGYWAIEKIALQKIRSTYADFKKEPKSFLHMFGEPEESDVLTIEDGVATIDVLGPLVDVHTCASMFFGCTSFEDIRAAIDLASEDDKVEKIVFNIDSPGGMVAGCDMTALAIQHTKKPTEARVQNLAASAAFWLASQCDVISALSATTTFGSIGVVVEFWDDTRHMHDQGFDLVQITSTGAPNKRVDPLTEDGERAIRADLDAIEDVFIKRVAEGRNVAPTFVLANFGQGGTFLAEKSKSVGMIDKTEFSINNIESSNKDNKPSVEEKVTSLEEFFAQNPEAQKDYDNQVAADVKKKLEENADTPANEDTPSKESEKNIVSKEDITAAKKYMGSEYPEAIKSLAVKVVTGESSLDSLNAAVAAVDAVKESDKSDKAQDDTDEVGDTPGAGDSPNSDGDSEEKYQAALKRTQNLK